MLKTRLVARKIAGGCTSEEAEKFVEFSDMANVMLCLRNSKPADLKMEVKGSDIPMFEILKVEK